MTLSVRAGALEPPGGRELLSRAALFERLDRAFGVRLMIVTAGAGFGKSTLLGTWVADLRCAWHTLTARDRALESLADGVVRALGRAVPDLMAGFTSAFAAGANDARAEAWSALLCERLHAGLTHDLVLVLDDVHEIGVAEAPMRLVESLCLQGPDSLHVVLASRMAPPFPLDRLRRRGDVLEVGGDALAFTVEEVAELLARAGVEPGLAGRLHAATGGWPVAVGLSLEALRRAPAGVSRERALEALRRPEGRLFTYLAREVFACEPPEVRELLRRMAPLGCVPVGLCEELGPPGTADVPAGLLRRGLALRSSDGSLSLHALLRDFVLDSWPLDRAEEHEVRRRTAAWFSRRGRHVDALPHLAATGEFAELARVLSRHGAELLGRGCARSILEAAGSLPINLRDTQVEQVVGEAYAVVGELEAALDCFRRVLGEDARIPRALGWRMIAAHYLRDDLDRAVETFDRCAPGPSGSTDESLLLSWTASARCRRGEIQEARRLAEAALRAAWAAADDRALAAAHAAAALVAEARGRVEPADAHQRDGLAAAARAQDVAQSCRLRTARGSLLLGQGLYREAIAELEVALGLGELVGCPSLQALSLMNRGLCRWCLGELDEANADYEAAIAIYRTVGTHEISYALIGRGDVHRERGELVLARAFYEEGLAIAERSGDRQGIVPGCYQLAKVLVDEDPAAAENLAERAVAFGWPDHASALSAQGWIALAHGERQRAARLAARAEARARKRRDRFGLAESLELATFSAPDPAAERKRLREARAIWREVGSGLREAAVELALARLSDGVGAHAAAARADRRLQRLGVRISPAGPAGLLRAVARQPRVPLTIDTLGGFRVRRRDQIVPPSAWRSKKARSLLKILVSRSGRPAPRDALKDALWPDADPATLDNRLSVALSNVRAILDPERQLPRDHFISSQGDAVQLELDHVAIDVEMFLHEVSAAEALREAGRRAEATEHLRAAMAEYTGDFLEEDLYEEWAIPLRERARAAYIAAAGALAADAEALGDSETAIRCYLRILERDPLHEDAHLRLVRALAAAGRHGDALGRYRQYCSLMREIGSEPAPYGARPVRA
jgi:ATP/maltotriose-dependent transcriptional regulator MalT/DNA-binding SARP family transcriptional activator